MELEAEAKNMLLLPHPWCTGRKEAASELRTRNLAIMSPMRGRYTNFVCGVLAFSTKSKLMLPWRYVTEMQFQKHYCALGLE